MMITTASRHPKAKEIYESLRGARLPTLVAGIYDRSVRAIIRVATPPDIVDKISHFFEPLRIEFELVNDTQYTELEALYEQTMSALPLCRQPNATWHSKSFENPDLQALSNFVLDFLEENNLKPGEFEVTHWFTPLSTLLRPAGTYNAIVYYRG
jgi:hypothetical protein